MPLADCSVRRSAQTGNTEALQGVLIGVLTNNTTGGNVRPMPAKRDLIDALSVRFAMKKTKRNAKLRVQTKRTMTLLLGAALSVGGVTEALEGAHFIVEKDLDQVRVVKRAKGEEKVVAELSDSFTANSVYKLAKVAPKKLVSYESSLFESAWLGPNSD